MTMKNSELLAYRGSPSLLTRLERQRQLLVHLHSEQQPCPSCGKPNNVFEASGCDVDDVDYTKIAPPDFHYCCKSCGRGLQHIVPFVWTGGPAWTWRLIPEPQVAVRTVDPVPVAEILAAAPQTETRSADCPGHAVPLKARVAGAFEV